MKKRKVVWLILILFSVAIAWGLAGSPAQTVPAGTVPVSMIVSVEAKHGGEIPLINREDVRVLQGTNRLRVTGWVPAQGDQAGLELFVLLDDSAVPRLAGNARPQFSVLRCRGESQLRGVRVQRDHGSPRLSYVRLFGILSSP